MIRPVIRADATTWCALRTALWPEGPAEEHAMEIERFFWSAEAPAACLVAELEGDVVGFVELSIRSYAEGCETDRIGYLEGWYVAPAWRRRGIGRALVQAAEQWAQAQGCREFASDTLLDNAASQAAHQALGFTESERIVCYCKPLRAGAPPARTDTSARRPPFPP
ncbi:MAG: GNAT family N-acetyltransferase [Gemmatimonadaceae bacterium]|nr:GNAT family N-acetyltransferase [Gemmatimonadaceae bacterium]